ncbi:hypothetical protein Pan216_34370 [Planctomycetes bacterium Pan216]|uniref:Uncharacterized protein n=1 Tax=Kolteria novifilia TaxID=2527975 RepID=A0A518B6G6_9BACT|nr:hypothetical protein Pan216_34370 [Planctomycetes bacterium Pan216]
MGRVIVDGAEVALHLPPDATLENAFANVRDQVCNERRVITHMSLNGQPLNWGDGTSVWSDTFQDIHGTLELRTDDTLSMCSRTLSAMSQLLENLAQVHRDVAKAIRNGDTRQGLATASQLMPQWEQLMAGVNGVLQILPVNQDDGAWREKIESLAALGPKMTEPLSEFRMAAGDRDLILLADLMDFEFAPLADEWLSTCRSFHEALTQHFRDNTEGHE